MSKIEMLLVDDDPAFQRRFHALGAGRFVLTFAASGSEALVKLERESPSVVLLDIDLGAGPSGLDVLRSIRRDHPDLPVIMISGDERPGTIVEAMREGAVGYVTKQADLELLEVQVRQALEQAAWRIHAREMQAAAVEALVGTSPAMAELRREIARVAGRRVAVLVRGESGTGKELVARAIHAASPRSAERLVVTSGAEGSEELFDALLFGHERGAFTGADQKRVGRIELAHKGTLFLDEVGRLSTARQAKLLRVFESGGVERLGGTESLQCDVRWITATNEDLEARVRMRDFREDFYYRIREYEILVPPLRHRLGDLAQLVPALLARQAAREGRRELPRLAADAIAVLADHNWPGNVRELDHVLLRAAVLAGEAEITADDLRRALRVAAPRSNNVPSALPAATLRAREERFSRACIEDALSRHGGVVTEAAAELGLSRSQLHRRLRELGLRGAGRD